jgi:hypothetical protein
VEEGRNCGGKPKDVQLHVGDREEEGGKVNVLNGRVETGVVALSTKLEAIQRLQDKLTML